MKAILQQPNYSSAARKFGAMAQHKESTSTLLAQLHVCLRHVEAHKGFTSDTKTLIDAYPVEQASSIA